MGSDKKQCVFEVVFSGERPVKTAFYLVRITEVF